MAHQQAELVNIGKEGFYIIDKYFGRPKKPYGNKMIYQEICEVPQKKEAHIPIYNKSNNIPSSNAFDRVIIYRSEVKSSYFYG